MHEAYREMIRARAEAAIAHARAAGGITHRPTKGSLREILVRDLFRPLLPNDVGVGTGMVVTASGRTSSQQDIVLYDRRILPAVVAEGEVGLFPIESVLYVIEVKSVLSARELRAADSSARDLASFDYMSGRFDRNDMSATHSLEQAISALFAFRSDLVSGPQAELQRFKAICGDTASAVRDVCVVDVGHMFWRRDSLFCRPGGEYDEVVSFLASILNRYRAVAASRGEPRIGFYLIDDG